MSIHDEMLLDMTEVTKTVYNDAHKTGPIVFDNERGFVMTRPEHGPRMCFVYLHIKNKYYFAPIFLSHTELNKDKFEQLCASLDDIEPRNIMRIIAPRLWTVTTAAA